MNRTIINSICSGSSCKKAIISIIIAFMIGSSLFIPIFKPDSFSIVVCIGVILSVSLILTTNTCHKAKRKMNPILYIFLLVIGLSFLLTGLSYGVLGYVAIGITFAIILCALNYYLSSSDIRYVYLAIADGVVVCFLMVLILSVFWGPRITVNQYSSLFCNPNILGNFNVIVNASLLYRLLGCYKKRSCIGYAVLLFFNISMCIFSNSRTSMIAIILQIIIYMFIMIRCKYCNLKLIDIVKKIICLIGIGIICYIMLFSLLSYSFNKGNEPVSESNEISNSESDKISIKENLEISSDRFSKGLDQMGETDKDLFTSGRIGIWKEYLEDIGIKGHASESKDIKNGDRIYKDTNAHNVYLQVAYSAGILAGIAYLFIAIFVFIKSIRCFYFYVRNRKVNHEVMYAIFASAGFGMCSLTSGGYMVYTYLPATLFWFTICALFIERNDNE